MSDTETDEPQLSRAQIEQMFADGKTAEIVAAQADGLLDDLLAGRTPDTADEPGLVTPEGADLGAHGSPRRGRDIFTSNGAIVEAMRRGDLNDYLSGDAEW